MEGNLEMMNGITGMDINNSQTDTLMSGLCVGLRVQSKKH